MSKNITITSNDENYYIIGKKEDCHQLINNCKENPEEALPILLKLVLEVLEEIEIKDLQESQPKGRPRYRNGYEQKTWHCLGYSLKLDIAKFRDGEVYKPFFIEALNQQSNLRDQLAVSCYTAGITTRKVGHVFETINTKFIDKSKVSRLNKEINGQKVADFNQRDFSEEEFAVILVDCMFPRCAIGYAYHKNAVYNVIGVDKTGHLKLLFQDVYPTECGSNYIDILQTLKDRNLKAPALFLSDAHSGIRTGITEVYPGVAQQLCGIHKERSTIEKIPYGQRKDPFALLKDIFEGKTRQESLEAINIFVNTCYETYPQAVEHFLKDQDDYLVFHLFEDVNGKQLYNTNPIERAHRQLKDRLNISGQFPDEAALQRAGITFFNEFYTVWDQKPFLESQEVEKMLKLAQDSLSDFDTSFQEEPLEILDDRANKEIIYILQENYCFQDKQAKINRNGQVLIAAGKDSRLTKQIIDKVYLTGVDNQKRLAGFIQKIRQSLDEKSDYLIIFESGHPNLERALQKEFEEEHLQYYLPSFQTDLLAKIPLHLKDCINDIFETDLKATPDMQTVQTIINSLSFLWQKALPKAAQLLKSGLQKCFNFLRKGNHSNKALRGLGPLNAVRKFIREKFTVPRSLTEFDSQLTAYLNMKNKKWVKPY